MSNSFPSRYSSHDSEKAVTEFDVYFSSLYKIRKDGHIFLLSSGQQRHECRDNKKTVQTDLLCCFVINELVSLQEMNILDILHEFLNEHYEFEYNSLNTSELKFTRPPSLPRSTTLRILFIFSLFCPKTKFQRQFHLQNCIIHLSCWILV